MPSRDAKTPTVDDIKRNAAFNRQLNANKAVGNLISIVQQLTANVNAAKNDLNIFQDQLTALKMQIMTAITKFLIFPIQELKS